MAHTDSLQADFEAADDDWHFAEYRMAQHRKGYDNSNALQRELAAIKHRRNSLLWRLRRAGQPVADANGGHTPECEGSCHPSCPIGQARKADADRRAQGAQALWAAANKPADDGWHRQHNDSPHDGDPVRPGRHCGPQCDLFEDPDGGHVPQALPPMTADERAALDALVRFERDARRHGEDPRAGDYDTAD